MLVFAAFWATFAPAWAASAAFAPAAADPFDDAPRACARAENSHLGVFGDLAKTHWENSPQVAKPHQEAESAGWKTASAGIVGSNSDPASLHKYLYAHADPVNNLDPTGHFSLSELQSTLGTIGTLARMAIPRAISLVGQAAARAGSYMVQAFARSVSWAWQAGRSGARFVANQLRILKDRIVQFSRSHEPVIYLHYGFNRHAGSMLASGLVGSPAYATWSVYTSGWAAKKGLALYNHGPRDSVYIVWPKKGFRGKGPSIVLPEIDRFVPGMPLMGGGLEFKFPRGSGGPGTVFGPIPIPTGSPNDGPFPDFSI